MSNPKPPETILVLRGSYQDFDRILALFSSGELEEDLGVVVSDLSAVSRYQPIEHKPVATNLDRWFQQNLMEGWQSETTLVGTFLTQQMNPAFATRTGADKMTSITFTDLVNRLRSEDQAVRFRAALQLGEQQDISPEAIATLLNEDFSYDALTTWQIALSLGKKSPDNPLAAIAQRREVNISSMRFELLIAVRKRDSGEIDILSQLYSTEDYYLPSDLRISLLRATRDILIEQDSNGTNPYLSLQFTEIQAEELTIKISCNDNFLEIAL
jgi:Protein of unknown function (DUF1822)